MIKISKPIHPSTLHKSN